MSPEQIEALKRAAEAATPGPWWTDGEFSEEERCVIIIAARTDAGPLPGNPTRGMIAFTTCIMQDDETRTVFDASYIALANPATILALLAEREANKARIAALEVALERVFTSGNHLGLLRTEKWPDYSVSWEEALFLFGAGPEYETWCAWSGIMRARAALRKGEPT